MTSWLLGPDADEMKIKWVVTQIPPQIKQVSGP